MKLARWALVHLPFNGLRGLSRTGRKSAKLLIFEGFDAVVMVFALKLL